MSRFLLPVIFFILIIPIFIIGLDRNKSELPSPLLNKDAPDYELTSLNHPDRLIGNDSYKNEMILLNVWATWCIGCREEHQFLMELSKRKTIPIYGLNWKDQRSDALRWLDQLGDPYVDTAFDRTGRVGIDWGVYGAPETFLIGSTGKVLYKHISPLTEKIWQQEFIPRMKIEKENLQ